MNEILTRALLYDFYGELLTKHQKNIYAQYVVEDLSMSEIAVQMGISRQGVHDLIRRSQKVLEDYEEKLHLVKRFLSIRENVREMEFVLESSIEVAEMIVQIRRISRQILDEL
ncbi:MAG: DNA-binding protein [Lachnospiraceae bacterium]|nr:DNA-binding protein [Lachnospiraceae bacterium]